jgi:hypothetical protein
MLLLIVTASAGCASRGIELREVESDRTVTNYANDLPVGMGQRERE